MPAPGIVLPDDAPVDGVMLDGVVLEGVVIDGVALDAGGVVVEVLGAEVLGSDTLPFDVLFVVGPALLFDVSDCVLGCVELGVAAAVSCAPARPATPPS